MKILLISTSYPCEKNGSEAAGSFVQDFSRALTREGHELAVMAPYEGKAIELSEEDKIKHFWFPVSKLPLSTLSPTTPKDILRIFTVLLSGKLTINKAVETFNPDHIFALWALPSGYWAKYAKKKYGIDYSVWTLGSDIWSLGKLLGVRNYLKNVLKNASHCFADGHQLLCDVTNGFDVPCYFLPSSRNLPIAKNITDRRLNAPFRLCFLGRWHVNKGVDLFIQALEILSDDDWAKIETIYIAGGGPLENIVKVGVDNLLEKGRPISLLGFQSKIQVAELFNLSDYIILPSRVESIPVVFSDAMQSLRPIVAMPVGDMPRLLEHYDCGVLVESVTSLSLSHHISKLIQKEELIFHGLHDAAKDFTPEKAAKTFLKHISCGN